MPRTHITIGGTSIHDILNTTVNSTSWTPITVPIDTKCHSILAGLRAGTSWKLSHLATGARYKTIKGELSFDISMRMLDTLFYAQLASGADVLEVILLN